MSKLYGIAHPPFCYAFGFRRAGIWMGQRGDGLSLGSQPNGRGRDSLGIADRSTSRGFFLQLELPGSMVASEQLDS